MNRPNNNNYSEMPVAAKHGSTILRAAAALVAGGVIALAGVLPVSAAPPTKAAAKAHKTATVHHTTKRHRTTAARRSTRTRSMTAMRPKQITIHGYSATHPYAENRGANAARISVTVGHSTTASTGNPRKGSGYPNEGHDTGTGGTIQNDGSVVAGPTGTGLPGPSSPAPANGNPIGPVLGGGPIVGDGPVLNAPPVIVTQPVVVPGNAPVNPVVPVIP